MWTPFKCVWGGGGGGWESKVNFTLGNLLSSSTNEMIFMGRAPIRSKVSWLSMNSMCFQLMPSLLYSSYKKKNTKKIQQCDNSTDLQKKLNNLILKLFIGTFKSFVGVGLPCGKKNICYQVCMCAKVLAHIQRFLAFYVKLCTSKYKK